MHICFDHEMPKAINKSIKGKVTIHKIGLDRKPLNEKRKDVLNRVQMIYKLAKSNPDTNEKFAAREFLLKIQKDETEYASMLRCFFKKNPIDF